MPHDSDTNPRAPERPSAYETGWNDGYAEGYACKLVDVTEPFMPSDAAPNIEAAAAWLRSKYAAVFTESEAIGVARGMIAALKAQRDSNAQR